MWAFLQVSLGIANSLGKQYDPPKRDHFNQSCQTPRHLGSESALRNADFNGKRGLKSPPVSKRKSSCCLLPWFKMFKTPLLQCSTSRQESVVLFWRIQAKSAGSGEVAKLPTQSTGISASVICLTESSNKTIRTWITGSYCQQLLIQSLNLSKQQWCWLTWGKAVTASQLQSFPTDNHWFKLIPCFVTLRLWKTLERPISLTMSSDNVAEICWSPWQASGGFMQIMSRGSRKTA